MARKAKPHDEELPFVALMDTMTNVVGVLIIVLVMIGIGLAKSVKKVLSELPLVSEEEHVQLKEELAKIDTSHDPAEVATDTAKLQKELEKIMETVKELEVAQAKNPVVLEDLEKLLKQLESLKKERDQRKVTVAELLAEIDKLKIKLDTTPPYVPPPGHRHPASQSQAHARTGRASKSARLGGKTPFSQGAGLRKGGGGGTQKRQFRLHHAA